jgi:hypothetical protein
MEQPTSGQNIGEPTPRAASDSTGSDSFSRPVTSMPAPQQRSWNDTMSQLDSYAERARVALPAAPPGLLNGYMRYYPWVMIVLGVLGVLVFLLPLIIGTALSPVFLLLGGPSGVTAGGALLLALVVAIIGSAVEVVSGYLMLKRRLTGWWLLAFGLVLSFLTNLFGRSIISLVVVLLIAYIHLQVKPNYTN